MHEPFFLRGTLLYSSSPDTIEILDDGWLLCRNGISAGEIPRIAGAFGLDTSTRANLSSAVYTAQTAINITKTVAKAAAA